MKAFPRIASIVSTLAAIVACSSSSTSTTGGSDCVSTLKTYCARVNDCAPLLMKAVYGDVATCESRVGLSCANYTAPGVQITGAQWSACGAAFSAISCSDITIQPDACNFKGTLANGAACGDDSQCSSGRCNNGTTTCGTCVAPVPENGDCSAAGSVCDRNLTCSNKVCVKSSSLSGKLAAGAECTGASPDTSCNTYQGLVCIAATAGGPKTCQTVKVATVGQPCGATAPGEFTACQASSCEGDTLTNRTCMAHLADGASCGNPDQKGSCIPGASCINNKCTVRDATTCK